MPPDAYIGQAEFSYLPHPGQTVALATLVEYAVATYGREHLPTLMTGLGQYDNWESLIPAVYGVPAAEFETGWQAYLAAHYGVAPAALSTGPPAAGAQVCACDCVPSGVCCECDSL